MHLESKNQKMKPRFVKKDCTFANCHMMYSITIVQEKGTDFAK